MVMEMPSPICVGREFVRQYYTMLHEAPQHLHRFYSHNSSFVHGGVEKPGEEQPPVAGQANIHKKIMSLNFRDCHAKIRQVDSQATVGNAVVVQVTGELSNNGLPMRRFMQTFVLAPQSPKKYYVHNDIFRYQDEVFHDNENDTEPLEESIDSDSFVVDADLEPGDVSPQPETMSDPAVTTYYEHQQYPPMSNGSAHSGERVESPPLETALIEEQPLKAPQPPLEADDEDDVLDDHQGEQPVDEVQQAPAAPEPPVVQYMVEEKEPEKTPEPEPMQEPEQEVQKPFTWAALTARNRGSGPAAPPTAPPPAVINKQPPGEINRPPIDPAAGPQQQRGPRPMRDRRDTRERDLSRGAGDGDDISRRSRFPDSQQLFVGNLPHNIDEAELKIYFEKFGKVLEVRINRKGTNRDVPNFGFVVFEETESVQKVLEARPLKRGSHRLNVEEKKQRSEQGGRPGSGTRLGRGGGGGMGPPRGGRGGGMDGGGAQRGGGMGGGGGMPGGRPDNRQGGPPGGLGGPPPRGGFGPPRR